MCARGIARNWGEAAAWLKGSHSRDAVGAQPARPGAVEGRGLGRGCSGCGPVLPEPPARRCPRPALTRAPFVRLAFEPGPAVGPTRLANGADACGRLACCLRGTCLNHKGRRRRLCLRRAREGAELDPFARAQRGSPAHSAEPGGRDSDSPGLGRGQESEWGEAGVGRGGGEAAV